mmetsp:Transcript_8207/g.13006  ORF Transcript_8207/g.13006 Transcript_8207/m.13006 type:complete len:226 (+) Transcript_8207:401-1078(+)
MPVPVLPTREFPASELAPAAAVFPAAPAVVDGVAGLEQVYQCAAPSVPAAPAALQATADPADPAAVAGLGLLLVLDPALAVDPCSCQVLHPPVPQNHPVLIARASLLLQPPLEISSTSRPPSNSSSCSVTADRSAVEEPVLTVQYLGTFGLDGCPHQEWERLEASSESPCLATVAKVPYSSVPRAFLLRQPFQEHLQQPYQQAHSDLESFQRDFLVHFRWPSDSR